MSATYTVAANQMTYRVLDDLAISYDVCVTGSLLDEASGTAITEDVTITANLAGIQVVTATGGLFALACYTDIVLPKLATQAYSIPLVIVVPNYRSYTQTIVIPAGSALPFVLAPIALRAVPVRVQGRIVDDVSRAPIAGAVVGVSNTNALALRTPAYFDHATGVDVIAVTVAAAGTATTLATPFAGGNAQITVASVVAIAPGQALQIGDDTAAEIATVESMNAPMGILMLANPLNSSFAAGTPVQGVTVTAAGLSSTLARDVNAGDGLLLLSPTLQGSTAISIQDGTPTDTHLVSAITDADGYYHLNAIGGLGAADFSAQAASYTTLTETYELAYDTSPNVLNFRLRH